MRKAHHLKRRRQWVFCCIERREALEGPASRVAQRIARIRRDENCGAYVLVSGQGEVHVLSEASLSTPSLVKEREADLIGLYAADTRAGPNPECPSAEQLEGDMTDHLESLGWFLEPAGEGGGHFMDSGDSE